MEIIIDLQAMKLMWWGNCIKNSLLCCDHKTISDKEGKVKPGYTVKKGKWNGFRSCILDTENFHLFRIPIKACKEVSKQDRWDEGPTMLVLTVSKHRKKISSESTVNFEYFSVLGGFTLLTRLSLGRMILYPYLNIKISFLY